MYPLSQSPSHAIILLLVSFSIPAHEPKPLVETSTPPYLPDQLTFGQRLRAFSTLEDALLGSVLYLGSMSHASIRTERPCSFASLGFIAESVFRRHARFCWLCCGVSWTVWLQQNSLPLGSAHAALTGARRLTPSCPSPEPTASKRQPYSETHLSQTPCWMGSILAFKHSLAQGWLAPCPNRRGPPLASQASSDQQRFCPKRPLKTR